MNSDCRQMIDVCKPRVYHDNIFHLTGLPVDATSRDIARRQDDLKAAEVSGDWKSEFRHLLMRNEIPTPENLRTAFVLMQDPERRFIDEFFWFWPLEWGSGKKDPALQHLLNGSYDAAITTWQTQQYAPDRVRLVSQHNLAVFYHFYAIDRELTALSHVQLPPAEFQQMADHWQLSFSHWESLAGDDDFWGIVTERIQVLNDPRMTTGFARRMRQAFPVAFDQINAHLALDYAKEGCYSDARRHVVYMKETHQGLDDVEQTVIKIFEPMEKRVGRMVDFATEAAKKDPANGLKAAQDLLDSSKESLEVTKGLLDDGHSTRTQLFDLVASTCFGCLIAYGNKTSDWKPCIDLLKKAEQLAVTEDLKKRVRENLAIATQNHEAKILHETCWFCKKKSADAKFSLEVKMYGDVRSSTSHELIHVPTYDKNGNIIGHQHWSRGNSDSRIEDYLNPKCTWTNIAVNVPRCSYCVNAWAGYSEKREYPVIRKLLTEGWKFGEKPSEDEMRKACGLKTQTEQQLQQFFSIFAYIGIILLLCGICSLFGC
jgi:hypothetical protein